MFHTMIMMIAPSFDFRSNRQILRNSNGEMANLLPANEWISSYIVG